MKWLDPLRRALDGASSSIPFFFRDDDAGWEDARLFELLDVFDEYSVPIDVAVIPKSLARETAARLRELVEGRPTRIAVHQHGYAHVNHEQVGRKCEFGETRSKELQLADITAGKRTLLDLLGPITDPIFTPPWNRCSATTADCLEQASFKVLSRDVTARSLNIEELIELPISVDWFARRKDVRLTLAQIGESLAMAASVQTDVGVMLHHAVMNGEERARVGELLNLLSSHSKARCVLMRNRTGRSSAGSNSRRL